jgi:hypothetical protein
MSTAHRSGLLVLEVIPVEDRPSDCDYWLRRSGAALAMARRATDTKVKLIHFDLAGRYALAAVAARLGTKPKST